MINPSTFELTTTEALSSSFVTYSTCQFCQQMYLLGTMHVCNATPTWFTTKEKFAAFRMAKKLKEKGFVDTLEEFIEVTELLAAEL